MWKSGLLAITLAGVAGHALAQTAPSGGQMQQIPPPPPAEDSQPSLELRNPPAPAQPSDDKTTVAVHALNITGQTVFSAADLMAITGFRPDHPYTLSQLRGFALQISGFYNRRGYILAQAYLPAQDVADGVVTIAVIEGRYDRLAVDGHNVLTDRASARALHGLHSGDVVAIAPLQRRLLLLSDLPGVNVHATLAPGAMTGTTDLNVDLSPGPLFSGSLDADNAGNRYTGEYRAGGTLNINNPTHHGDIASLRVLTSGRGLTYVRAAYQTQLGDASLGVAYSHLNYRLGKQYSVLDAHGTAEIASLYASYPLIRSRNADLYLVADVDERCLEDRVDLTSSVSARRARTLLVGLNGDWRDDFGGGGRNNYSLSVTTGDLDIRTPSVRAADATTARTDGQYSKVNFSLSRLQTLPGSLSFYGDVRGQVASKNLDISEKMELGGAYGVRAYPEGEAYGDEGYIATAELRWLLRPMAAVPGRVQLAVFADTGSVRASKNPWFPGANTRTLSGAGVGATWAVPHDLLISISYAWELGGEAATSAPDHSGRGWIRISKRF
jgi:hemolysin activation/secretion protein